MMNKDVDDQGGEDGDGDQKLLSQTQQLAFKKVKKSQIEMFFAR